MLKFLKTMLLGGLLVVLPLGILAGLAVRAVKAIYAVVVPLVSHLPGEHDYPLLFAIAILLGACFLTGLAIQTGIGKSLGGFLEQTFLVRLPGYGLLKSLDPREAGESEGVAFKAAMFAFTIRLLSNGLSLWSSQICPRAFAQPKRTAEWLWFSRASIRLITAALPNWLS